MVISSWREFVDTAAVAIRDTAEAEPAEEIVIDLVTDKRNTPATIPSDEDFKGKAYLRGDFLPGEGDLFALGKEVIQKHKDVLGFVETFEIDYWWKRKGSTGKGNQTLGTCEVVSRKMAMYSDAQFIVTVSANFLRDGQFTLHQLEALIFHELKHIAINKEMTPVTVGHEFEGFTDEIERYGLWTNSARMVAPAFQQASMDL